MAFLPDPSSFVKLRGTYRSFATKQHCHNSKFMIFSGETFQGFEVLKFSSSAKTTHLLSSGEFCKLRYDTVPVKS
jgi:hypothetical protein